MKPTAATAIAAGLLSLLLVGCGVSAAGVGGTSTPSNSEAPETVLGALSGTVSGLAEGDEATLTVAPVPLWVDPDEEHGDPVLQVDVGNGDWQMPLDGRLEPGEYGIAPSAEDYVSIPGEMRFSVSQAGVTYHYDVLDFELLKPEEAEERLGMPICDDLSHVTPQPTATATPTQPPPDATPEPLTPDDAHECQRAGYVASFLERGMTGTISGLPDGVVGHVWIDRLPDREGECYWVGAPPPWDCTHPEPLTGPIIPMPYPVPGTGREARERTRIATLEVSNGRWGFVDPSLAGHPYAVGFTVDAPHELMGGYNVVVYMSKLPSVVDGVDFAFVPRIDDGTPTATPHVLPGVTPTPTPTFVPPATVVPREVP